MTARYLPVDAIIFVMLHSSAPESKTDSAQSNATKVFISPLGVIQIKNTNFSCFRSSANESGKFSSMQLSVGKSTGLVSTGPLMPSVEATCVTLIECNRTSSAITNLRKQLQSRKLCIYELTGTRHSCFDHSL